MRFYKAATNTGTHVGNLWSNSGTLLATATFTGETASGWQQVTFATPVAITANTTYVASYHTNDGPLRRQRWRTSRPPASTTRRCTRWRPASTAPTASTSTAPAAFPTQTFNATNYWVDVVFNTGAPDTTPPTVTSVDAGQRRHRRRRRHARDGDLQRSDERRDDHDQHVVLRNPQQRHRRQHGQLQREHQRRDADADGGAGRVHDLHGDVTGGAAA